MSHSTDLRKLLIEAAGYVRCFRNGKSMPCGDCEACKLSARISAAPAEPVEPVGEFSGMRITPEGTREFYGHIEPGSIPPLPGTKLYAAPAEQWRRVEDGLPHTDHPMRHYDRTCPACNTALPEGDK